jgi:hypothetical protein
MKQLIISTQKKTNEPFIVYVRISQVQEEHCRCQTNNHDLYKAISVQGGNLISNVDEKKFVGKWGLECGHGGHRSKDWASHLACHVRAKVSKNESPCSKLQGIKRD